ncbi:MAG: DUF4926 domain-containing protein [Pirellulaceae bacterium]
MKEHDLTVLTRDLSEQHLLAGDVGTIVHAYPQGGSWEVEFMAADGRTIAVLTLTAADIRPQHADEILHVRSLALA